MTIYAAPESADISSRVLTLAIRLQQTAAPTFQEEQRGLLLLDAFRHSGLVDAHSDAAGNVLARFPGLNPNLPSLVVSAHLDSVFPLDTDLTLTHAAGRIAGPGIGDNALGTAALLGLVWALQAGEQPLPGDLWVAGTTGEEGLGNLHGMSALVDHFGKQARAHIIVEGMGLGHIFHRGLCIERYRLVVETPGGHAWIDYGKPSAIHELAGLINRITRLALPEKPRTTLNVGVIEGGTSINTLAASASCEIDLRSETSQALKLLVEQVHNIPKSGLKPGTRWRFEKIGARPAGEIPQQHPLVRLAQNILAQLGVTAQLGIGSTDANAPLSRGLPAICIGITTGSGAHTTSEFINTEPVGIGLKQLTALVRQAWTVS
jgi:acetylornithine deacetylase/succinyl-diaminopimelate desuccinylase-like protein